MATKFTAHQTSRFKREAKKISRKLSIPHSNALDHIAYQHGFKNWSLLMKYSEASQTNASPSSFPLKPLLPKKTRYYIHGDQYQENPILFFCNYCDAFLEAGHFNNYHCFKNETQSERYLSSLARWNKRSEKSKLSLFRPDNAPNLLSKNATQKQANLSPFYQWLLTQTNRDDPVGDLAVDATERDKKFPVEAVAREELEDYLSLYGNHAVSALQQAWREFLDIQNSFRNI